MLTAFDVAGFFLARPEDELLSHLKLQKLLYYAQGFYLANFDRPLFLDEIYAWQHGPVVKSVWDQFGDKYRGGVGIPPLEEVVDLNEETASFLEEVWLAYGQFSAWRLRELTHETGPWKNALINSVISHDSMRDWFKTELVAA